MHSLEYAQNWGELVTGQITATRKSDNPDVWGYACLCIGRQFDKIFEGEYLDIDHFTGEYLHVFSLTPPPLVLAAQRLKIMESLNNPNLVPAIEHLSRSVKKRQSQSPEEREKWREELRHEQLRMIEDLKTEGMKISSNVDFLFFDFRQTTDNKTDEYPLKIDVFGGMQSPMEGNQNNRQYIRFFEQMGEKAKRSYEKGDTVEQFVKSLQLRWSGGIAINKTRYVSQYLSCFLGAFGAKGA